MNNKINNNYNKEEVKNKLKNFEEGSDYSVLHEGKKEIFNFHNNFLRDIMGDNWTTVYEAAENWDSDNFNHHREAAEYVSNNVGESGNRGRIIYRYEHKINKDASGYKEWSWGEDFFRDGYKHSWTLRKGPSPNFKPDFGPNRTQLEELEWKYGQLKDKLSFLLNQPESDFGVNGKEKKEHEIAVVRKDINYIGKEIEKEKNNYYNVSRRPDWISCPVCDKTFNKAAEVWGVQDDSGFQPTCCHGCAENFQGKEGGRIIKSGSDEYFRRDLQQRGRMGRNEKGSFITDEADNNQSDLAKENQELKKRLAEVENQLKGILEELKKLRNNSTGQNKAELDQQIDYNEKLIRNVEVVPEAEIKEQVQKSQVLLEKGASVNNIAPTENKPSSSSLPYVIGGSVLVSVVAIIGYYLLKKNKEKKVA